MQGTVRQGGLVFVRGELWRVRASEPLSPGQSVVVDALTASPWELPREVPGRATRCRIVP